MKILIDSDEVLQQCNYVSISQSMVDHHQFEIRQSLEDLGSSFNNILQSKSEALIGKPVTIEFKDNEFNGIITSLSIDRSATGGSVLLITGYSPGIMLDYGAHTKSFYENTLKQIVSIASEGFKGDFENEPVNKSKLKYIVQYREGNYQFIARLAAAHGEWFFYDGKKLYFGKKPPEGEIAELRYGSDIQSLSIQVRAVPTNIEFVAYDYKGDQVLNKKPEYAKLDGVANIAYTKSSNEIFAGSAKLPYNQSMNDKDLEQLARINGGASLGELVCLQSTTSVEGIKIGGHVHVLDPRLGLLGGNDDYGKYIITKVTHTFSIQGDQYDYSNFIEGIPSDVSHLPLYGSIHPPFCEVQLANVKKIDDEDQLGRVRVQFLWQADQDMSPWIRVSSPYTGADKGVYMVPEIDDQVLVGFENNNPERPFVLSGWYNSKAKPQYFDKDNYKKAIRTAGGNEILMNDKSGSESFGITSPKDVSITATGGKMTISADAEISITSNKKNITIDTPETITLHAKKIVLQADSEIQLEAPNIVSTASADYKVSALKVTIEADTTHSIKGGLSMDVDGGPMTNIKGGVLKLN